MLGETIFKFSLLLISLIVLWGFSEWLVRYKKGFYERKENNFLEPLENLNLTQNSSLQLIKVGENKIILLAISPNRADMILSLERDELKPLERKGEKA